MKIQIKHRFSNKILFEGDYSSTKECLISAVNKKIDLGDAYLVDANLEGANLRGANLVDANLRGANLRGANLVDANLGDAYLGGANLGDAYLGGANLVDANLGDANLRDANLRGANLEGAKIISFKSINQVGENQRTLFCFKTDKGLYFQAGCFFGKEKKLKEMIVKKYGKDCEYMEAIKYLKRAVKKY